MPKVISYSKMRIENVVLTLGDGWEAKVNYTLQSDEGNIGGTVTLPLTQAQTISLGKMLKSAWGKVLKEFNVVDAREA